MGNKRTSVNEILAINSIKGPMGLRDLFERFPNCGPTFRKAIGQLQEGGKDTSILDSLYSEVFGAKDLVPDSYDPSVNVTTKDILEMMPESWGVTQPMVSVFTRLFGLTEVGKFRAGQRGKGASLYERAQVESAIAAINALRPEGFQVTEDDSDDDSDLDQEDVQDLNESEDADLEQAA